MKINKLLIDSFWTIGGQLISLIVVLISNIILARLLSPAEFGELAITMFFISIFNVFTDGGMAAALVRKQDKIQDDYSTVFTFNFIISLFFFIFSVCISGFISRYYKISTLKTTIIFASLILIISSFQTIQNVKLLQKLEFKKRSLINLTSTLLGVIVGLATAYYLRTGVFALVSIPVTTVIVQTILYNYYEGFYFKLKFKKSSFRELFGFGINTTMISVLNIGFNNVYQIIMGRIFSINQVGYFYQAQKLQDVPNNIVNNLSQSVFYSTLSKKQNKIEELVKIYQLISRTSLSLMGLAVIIFLFFGQDIILVLFGDKWVESAYYIKFLICGSLFYTQELINKIIFKIFNKTRILLKLEIFKKLVHTATLLIGIYTRSIEIFMYGFIATNIFSYSFNYYQTNKIIKMGKDEIINFIKILMLISILSIINYYNYQTGLRSNLFSFCLIIIYCLSLNILNILKLKELKESK